MAMSGASPNHSPKPGVSSPWSQIVAAAAPPSSSPPPPVVESAMVNSVPAEDSDSGAGHNVNSGKRPAWNKPSNGVSSSVMGAETWPALSESARASVKSTSPSPSPSLSESSKGSSEVSPLQGSGSVVPSPQRHVRDNASANNTVQAHQKSFKRSNSNTSSNGGNLLPQMSVPQSSVAAAGSHNHNSSPKEHQPRAGFVPNDHPPQRNSYRHRNGGGPHQRGDYHHHNYGGRRDQDRGHDWNNHRNFNGRDNYMSPRIVPRFIRPQPPPNHAQFYPPGPPPMRPYGGSYGYHELHPQMVYVPPPALESFRGVSYMSPMPPNAMYFPPPDTQLHAKIVNQINYYFSNENLVKDLFLRRKMDDQGWVPISLIAGFKKVKFLTDNIQIVLDAVRTSSVVEVQGDKIRRRNDWRRWIMPADQLPNVRGSQTIGQLAEQVQSIALETTNNDDAGVLDAASQNRPFGDLNSQYMLSTSEGTGSQVGIQVSDHSISARN
ncbi:la-related protein 1C [Cajanus cajan]|uniref:La-related protein 1B n=1 Tax=Cajanus cajan TaxID=3821 RepID=A0A151RBB3_CAJCA|nr:la-related protein 1C [Cajanus cajan]KYP39797.1 La-related protein 1B [Cajanus cajan]